MSTAAGAAVVVGVDGSASSRAAVRVAATEVVERGRPLRIVHAWGVFDFGRQSDILPLVDEPDSLQSEEHRVLSESLAGWAQQYPEVQVKPELVRGRPAAALVERSRTAQLMVTGARGRGGFAGLLLGSVSQTLMHHADCPVAVVRAA